MFSIRGLRLYFPELEPWVAGSALLPAVCPVYLCANVRPRGLLPTALPALFSDTLSPALSVYLCANVGPQGLPVVRLPAPLVPHSTSLSPATATQILSVPVPVSAPPTGLDECLFFISLVLDLLAIQFFCQFWLCEEAQCVYLRRHLGSPQFLLKGQCTDLLKFTLSELQC